MKQFFLSLLFMLIKNSFGHLMYENYHGKIFVCKKIVRCWNSSKLISEKKNNEWRKGLHNGAVVSEINKQQVTKSEPIIQTGTLSEVDQSLLNFLILYAPLFTKLSRKILDSSTKNKHSRLDEHFLTTCDKIEMICLTTLSPTMRLGNSKLIQ